MHSNSSGGMERWAKVMVKRAAATRAMRCMVRVHCGMWRRRYGVGELNIVKDDEGKIETR